MRAKTRWAWVLLISCAAVIVLAMSWMSRNVLQLERQNARVQAAAELDDRVRSALWRMDTLASAILAEIALGQRDELIKDEIIISRGDDGKFTFQPAGNVEPAEMLRSREDTANIKESAEPSQSKLQVLNALAVEALQTEELAQSSEPSESEQQAQHTQQWAAQQRAEGKAGELRQDLGYNIQRKQVESLKRKSIVSRSNISANSHLAESFAQPGSASLDSGDVADAEPSGQVLGDVSKFVIPAELSPFRAAWVDGELTLVRMMNGQVKAYTLDARRLMNELLAELEDVLPNASLLALADDAGQLEQVMALSTFPLVLNAGEEIVDPVLAGSQLRKTLAMAWLGALLMIVAVFVLFAGIMRLSERRASFVSSVTHELRTPLTTFSLYSDMLASGMVRSEEKQKQYLQTLKRESMRLNHLVENVLLYSRIERGSARAQVESLSYGQLIQRLGESLAERCERELVDFQLDPLDDDLADRLLRVDVTSIEQVIFNLVDNAIKYGADDDGCVQVKFSSQLADGGDQLELRIGDRGAGVSAAERRKIFKPFHKSAAEAAHSKPGVGLGLALSSSLAKEMHGSLELVDGGDGVGACFVLRIPAVVD
ncbi:HAMP domain-containing histidine kinase [Persicirhabdus sediminis]|uniref:histidine kinase n=1 Tax=Persicirhabdus sediminis TaxID=454144 RepID=A0A8J7MCQ1_9BACT|nr:HAMP domain-containing histidine kinase [Persicirhabdus sediminis]